MSKCVYFPPCGGCSGWDTSYEAQTQNKTELLKHLLKEKSIAFNSEIDFVSCGEDSLRHRVDLTLQHAPATNSHTIGFYDTDRQLLSIERCRQLSPALQTVYSEFRTFRFFYGDTPIRKGSVRLRTGPTGLKGCWLDFSNMDIKNLLEDQRLLTNLLEAGFIVEIGQKGKKLIRKETGLKLVEGEPQYWFKTPAPDTGDLLLKSLISDFTQPSWTSADRLVQTAQYWLKQKSDSGTILEFGAGIGQFTLGFLKAGFSVEVCEIDETSTRQLRLNTQLHGLEKNIGVHIGDFHKTPPPDQNYECVFVNPARSGLKNFAHEILKFAPKSIIYISCYPESMAEDLKILTSKFRVCNIRIVDQFPQTKHFETCVFLEPYIRE